MLIPPPGGNPVHPAITPSAEPKCHEFQSQLKQVSADFAHLQTARDKLHWDENHRATQAQIKKDRQAIQSDAEALATAANRLVGDLENSPVSHQKEMQDRASRRDQARIEERVKSSG
jgi:hypothetical protein